MSLNNSVIEAASWRLASQIHRRHPHLRLLRAHPGGGQSDVLWLKDDDGTDIRLNRVGTIQVQGRADGGKPSSEPISWETYLSTDPVVLLRKLQTAACLNPNVPTPPSTPIVLSHRVIAGLTALHTFSEPLAVEVGYVDTSGFGGGPSPWMRQLPPSAERLARPHANDLFGEPGYRFWRLTGSHLMASAETTTGTMWNERGEPLDLLSTYKNGGRILECLMGQVLRHIAR